jgi:HK97 family phage prohead protease
MEDYLGPWVESVNVGAFGKTLTEGADVAFLLNHEGMTLARTKSGTLKLSEETDGARSPVYGVTGLHSEALLDPLNPMVRAMRSAVERSDLDSMSFAFRVTSQEWNEDFTRRRIQAVNLDFGDVSLVNYPGNPHTAGSVSLRQRFRGFGPRTFRAVEDEDLCNRCGGDGSISLQGKTVPCPQCKGSGTGENNATVTDAELKAMAQRARLRLAQLRYPPGDPGRRIAAFEPQSHRGRLERLRHPPR